MSVADIKKQINIDATSGITGVISDSKSDAPFYDLLGRRVNTVKQGRIYIQNNKKIVVR